MTTRKTNETPQTSLTHAPIAARQCRQLVKLIDLNRSKKHFFWSPYLL